MPDQTMTLPVQTMAGGESDKFRSLTEKIGSELRVAAPGIIQSYNAATNTATVQLAIREKVNQMDGTTADTDLPLLLDCPVMMPRGGGFALTFPVAAGDECLVVFADACIDSWWQSGGVQNQAEKRRHDLSDGIVIPGLWSQPNKLAIGEGIRLTATAGGASVALTASGVTLALGGVSLALTASGLALTGGEMTINGQQVEVVS